MNVILLPSVAQRPISGGVLRILLAAFLVSAALVLVTTAISKLLLENSARRQIAFYSYRDAVGAVYLMDVDRLLQAPMYRTSHWVVTMAWSPDGRRLAFIAYEDGYYILYTMDVETLKAQKLTDQTASNKRPVWSSDGRWIAFESTGYAPFSALFVVDAQGGRARDLIGSVSGGSSDLAWSDSGQALALAMIPPGTTTYELYALDAACLDGVSPCTSRRLTTNSANDLAPAWSPDGTRMAFVSDRDGAAEVYTLDLECGALDLECRPKLRQLTRLGIASSGLSWSPDGRWLSFEVWPNGTGSVIFAADMNCVFTDNDCSWLRQLTSADNTASNADWSPDGREIAFISRIDGTVIALLDLASCSDDPDACEREARPLTSADVTSWYPVWRPGP